MLEVKGLAVPNNVEVKAGDTVKEVAKIEVKAKQSSINIQRIYVDFNSRPHRLFNYISIYEGNNPVVGKAIAAEDVIDVGGGFYRVVINTNISVAKDTTKTFGIRLSAVPVYPSGAPSSVQVKIPGNGVRGIDTAGIQQYAPSGDITRTVSLGAAVSGKLEVRIAADTPEEGLALISNDTTVDTEIDLTKFTLKAKDLDVIVKEISATTTDNSGGLLKALRLYDGTTLLQEVSTGTTIQFTDLDLTVAKDATKSLVIKGVVSGTSNVRAGDVKVDNVRVTLAEDANFNLVTPSPNDADGETIYLYTVAPIISNIQASAQARDMNATSGPETIEGRITFSITARGGDIWISTSTNDLGVEVQRSDGTTTSTASAVVLSTNVSAGTWGYKVGENQTVTFTVDATHDPPSAGYWRIVITRLTWNTRDDSSGVQTWNASWQVGDLKTGFVNLTAD